jgi:S-DNA-T family DNA segregation ATPase FtsK/SpoIIIE
MTASKKRTGSTAKKTGTSKKTAGRAKTEDFSSFYAEIGIWAAMAVAALLLLGNFGLCGQFGYVVSSILFGTFGVIQYILPVVTILLGALLWANHFSTLAVKKSLLVIVFLCMVATIAQMFVNFDGCTAFEAASYSFTNHTGGGAIGGGIYSFLHRFFGKAGSVLIVTVISMISLMLIFEKSVLRFFREMGIYTSEVSRQRKEHREEMQKIREDEREKEEVRLEEMRLAFRAKAALDEKKQKKALEKAKKKGQREAEERMAQRRREQTTAVSGAFHDIFLLDPETIEQEKQKHKERKMVDLGEKFGWDTKFEDGFTVNEEPMDTPSWSNEKEPVDTPPWSDGKKEPLDFADSLEEEFVMPKKTGLQDSLTELTERAIEDTALSGKGMEDTVFSGDTVEDVAFFENASEKMDIQNTTSVLDEIDSSNMAAALEEADSRNTESVLEKTGSSIQEEHSSNTEETVHKDPLKVARPAMDEDVAQKIMDDMDEAAAAKEKPYVFPPVTLLEKGENSNSLKQQKTLRETAQKLQQTLANFGVNVTITHVSCGPAVTRYELQPEQGVKVSKIVGLSDDIKLNLAAADIRIEAPIPGKAAVGIEVPNKHNEVVKFRDLIENEKFAQFSSNLVFAVGKDIGGKVVLSDIAKMPHLLIAGATGSGKSVCINTLIMSILYKAKPSDVKFIMIDPKVVELSTYNGIPHLLIPVVTDPQKAAGALNWAVVEMQDRYKKFAEYNVRNLQGYNQKVEEVLKTGQVSGDELKKLPQIVIIVDELADLMMVAPGEVENAIVRLSQLARAAGIHLVIATQRPSVNVITGLIKANVPSRIAFAVSSGVDSRTIIDMNGAEKLLGRGDMLFYPQGQQKPIRVQGAFISDEEVGEVVEFLKEQNTDEGGNQDVSNAVTEKIENNIKMSAQSEDRDEYFAEAARFILTKEKASIGMIQRMFKVGFNRASRIMEQLADAGIVGPEEGTKPRKILMTEEQLEQYLEEYL